MQAAYVAWTPDSKSLAVSSGSDLNYRILLMSAEAGDARPLVTPLTKSFSVGDISLPFLRTDSNWHSPGSRQPLQQICSLCR